MNKQNEKYKTMLRRKNKEKKIYKDKNSSLQFEKQKLYKALLNREKEIERLNNIIELALDYLDNGYCYCKDKKIPKPYFDYQELVNILKGSEKE